MLQPRKKIGARKAKLISDRKTDKLRHIFEAIEKAASWGKYDLYVGDKDISNEDKSRLEDLGYEFMYTGADTVKKEKPHKVTWYNVKEDVVPRMPTNPISRPDHKSLQPPRTNTLKRILYLILKKDMTRRLSEKHGEQFIQDVIETFGMTYSNNEEDYNWSHRPTKDD